MGGREAVPAGSISAGLCLSRMRETLLCDRWTHWGQQEKDGALTEVFSILVWPC